MGEYFVDPDDDTINRVLAELDEPVDEEHPDVSLAHESGWSLSAFPSGRVIWENDEELGPARPRHLSGVTRKS